MARRRSRPAEMAPQFLKHASYEQLKEDKDKAPSSGNATAPAEEALLSIEKADVLKRVLKYGLAGGFDFREGDTGVGVVQTHETMLYEQQLQTEPMGWKAVTPTDREMEICADLLNTPVDLLFPKLNEEGERWIDTYFLHLDRFFKEGEWSRLASEEQAVVAKLHDINIHTDIRFARQGTVYWEGGECLTPFNQFTSNGLLDMETSKVDPGYWEALNLAPSDVGASNGAIIRGPLEWMVAGQSEPLVLPPGAPGATLNHYGRLTLRGTFQWQAGIQDEEYKEFWLTGAGLTGRWVVSVYPNDRDSTWRIWVITKPRTQTMRSTVVPPALPEGTPTEKKTLYVPIFKSANGEAKRLVTGVVLQPEVVDAQGEIYSEDVIEEAAYNFMMDYREKSGMKDMHRRTIKVKGRDADAAIVASWVTHEPTMINGTPIKKGSWLITVKVHDDTMWKKVQSGDYRGFSIGGLATAERYST